MEIKTLRDIKNALNNLSEEELDQPAQIWPYDPAREELVELQIIIAFDKIGNFCNDIIKTRSTKDNEHHQEHYVFLIDGNPYDEDGNWYWTMQQDGTLVANKTGEVEEG